MCPELELNLPPLGCSGWHSNQIKHTRGELTWHFSDDLCDIIFCDSSRLIAEVSSCIEFGQITILRGLCGIDPRTWEWLQAKRQGNDLWQQLWGYDIWQKPVWAWKHTVSISLIYIVSLWICLVKIFSIHSTDRIFSFFFSVKLLSLWMCIMFQDSSTWHHVSFLHSFVLVNDIPWKLWWTSRLFPPFNFYKQCYYKQVSIGCCLITYLQWLWIYTQE